MKRLAVVLTIIAMTGLAATIASAVPPADQSQTSTVTASVGNIFSLAFYNDDNVIYNTSIPFSSVNPSSQYNYADTRAEFDNKSDVGLLVITNYDLPWYLKIQATDIAGTLASAGKIGLYMDQPINRNIADTLASGSLGQGVAWYTIPTTIHTLYSSAGSDNNNTPYGTLATLNFKVDGTGVAPGSHSASLTYTLTTTP